MANREAYAPASIVDQQSENHSKNNHILGNFIIVIIIFFIAAWICLCFCFRRKFFGSFRKHNGKLDAEKMNLRHFSLEQLQRATNNFSEECLVGSGAFGNVYRATFSERTLAIKKPLFESYTTIEEFRNEVRLISNVKHENLVELVGFCQESCKGLKSAKILVYEYVKNGSLLDYIMGTKGKNLTWRQRVNIAIGAAKGLAHLHEGVNPSIIHRDIKPSNILIGEGFEAKISDFGLVRLGPVDDQSHVSSVVKGTPGYLDPAYCTSLHLTPFTDVYSFGVILLQLLAARPAVESSRSANSFHHIIDWARASIERGQIEDILDMNLLLGECNMEVMLKMGRIGLRCVVGIPKKRPTMTQVWGELEAALNLADKFMPERPFAARPQNTSRSLNLSVIHGSVQSDDDDYSQSIVSVDGIGLQRFHVDMDSLSFQNASLRCLETSLSMDESFNMP